MEHIEKLRNAIWYSLIGPHKHLALGSENVKHYPLDMAIGARSKNNTDNDLRELATCIEPGQIIALVGMTEQNTDEWTTLQHSQAIQMVCPERIPIPEHDVDVSTLTNDDVTDMLALIKLTEPGPFEKRTIEMGPYIGI